MLSRAHRAYGRKGCTAGGEETGDGNERTKAMGKACWLVSLCFHLFMLFPFARPCLALVFVMSLLRRHGCCCCGARWRLVWGYVDREGCFGCRGLKRLLWSKGKIKMRAELGGQEKTAMVKKKGEWRLFRGLWEWRGCVAGENGRFVEMGGRRNQRKKKS